MVETDDEGRPRLYWISHKTQLLRAARHHVRPDFTNLSAGLDGLEAARHEVSGLRSRGVTRFLDLSKVNRRNIDAVDVEEAMDDELDLELEPPTTRRRTDDHPGLDLELPDGQTGLDFAPGPSPLQSEDLPEDLRDLMSPRSVSCSPSILPDGEQPLQPQVIEVDDDNMPPTAADTQVDEPEPGQEPPHPGTPHQDPQPSQPLIPSEPLHPPSSTPPSTSTNLPTLDPATAALHEPSHDENFANRRLRVDQQETMLFGPVRRRTTSASRPYSPPAGSTTHETAESYMQSFDITDVDTAALPEGWILDDGGNFMLTDDPLDFWELKAGCLIRHHVRPRRALFKLGENISTPVNAELLDRYRTTVIRTAGGNMEVVNDFGETSKYLPQEWTGRTVFQFSGKARRELGMYANLPSKRVGKDLKVKMAKQQKNVIQSTINEKTLTAADRAKFQEAKCKELKSFFENQVWEFDSAQNADPERTLTARVLTKWSKSADGSPRAKARLIVRGYQDIDALDKGLETASPTTSRTSRSFLVSLTAILGWSRWSSDVATAFLQGLPQQRKLWVKLPAECLNLLGAPPETRTLLLKPVYGQLDAPPRWWLEAKRRLLALGLRQHCLDPCFFLAYETDYAAELSPTGVLGDNGLCGCICLHVDDMLGSGNISSPTWNKLLEQLRQSFNFREWKELNDDKPLEYCGAKLEQMKDGGIKLHHDTYLGKIHPMTLPKHVGPETDLSAKEITQLRGLCGALQWPAVQSSPHLRASTSISSGLVNKAKASTVTELNGLLKFAKTNADVGLYYKPLGDVTKLRLITMFDAAFSSRPDGTSQGGYLVMLAPEHTLVNQKDWFHLLDWRSLKPPRVARSSLAAEAQAAAQAADATDFVSKFYDHMVNPDLQLAELLQRPGLLKPIFITDAKALYDSYHRETVSANLTDRRVALEILVVKQLMTDLSGELRWVSSERQWADGLTKTQARQLLADRLRHGRIGFYWDPNFTAAKKKNVEERQANMTMHAKPPSKRASSRRNRTEDEEMEAIPEDEQFPVEAYVGTGRCYAVFTNDMIDYKDVAESNDTSETFAALLVNLRYGMSFTPLSILPSTWLSLALSLLTLVFVTVSFLCRWLWRKRLQQAYQEGYDAAWNEHRQEMSTIRALPIFFDHMNEEMERYVRNRDIWIDGDQQQDLAIPICRRALHEATNHADMCPWNDRIWMSRDGLWHTDPMCESLPRGQEMRRNHVWVAQPCGRCMPTPVTPYFVDRFGTTLHDELETWITDQGAEAWPFD